MLVKEAKAVARRWVLEEAHKIPGFYGAYYAGSTTWLADDSPLPATSDVDIMVVLTNSTPPNKIGKFIYRDVLLEVSYLPIDDLPSAGAVLGHYHLAGSFRSPNIILDPSGYLTKLQAEVSQGYAKRHWVYQRCQQAYNIIIERLHAALNPSAPLHDQVMSWVFAVGGMPHVLLVAGLQNPTVRKRYVAAQKLLQAYGRADFYETLLDWLGCAHMSRERVEAHLAALADVFDATTTAIKTPFFFTADISTSGRAVAIDGSRELIEQGYHREAIFWMVVTYSRCQKALYHDAPKAVQERFTPGYRQLLEELGITSPTKLHQQSEPIKAFLPQLWEVTEAILAANPEIEE